MGRAQSSHPDIEEQRGRYERHGQDHVFRFWDRLDSEGRERLARQAAAIDLPAVLAGFEATRHAASRVPELVPVFKELDAINARASG